MRYEMQEVFYAHLDNMTILNGYNFDWFEVRSKGNGTLALKSPMTTAGAYATIEYGNSETLQSLTGAKELVQCPLIVSASSSYKMKSVILENQDIEEELVRSKLLEDIRKGFRFVTAAMCAVGVQNIYGAVEVDPEVSDGSSLAMAKIEFKLQYFE